MKRTVKIKVSNNFPEPITLWLEPSGADFGMMPKDEFELSQKTLTKNSVFTSFSIKIFKFMQKDKAIIREFIEMAKNLKLGITDFGTRKKK